MKGGLTFQWGQGFIFKWVDTPHGVNLLWFDGVSLKKSETRGHCSLWETLVLCCKTYLETSVSLDFDYTDSFHYNPCRQQKEAAHIYFFLVCLVLVVADSKCDPFLPFPYSFFNFSTGPAAILSNTVLIPFMGFLGNLSSVTTQSIFQRC